MTRKIIYIVALIAFSACGIFAQNTSPQMSPTPANLENILSEAEKQTVNYQAAFSDLLATETKTFEKFDKQGELKNQTVVESLFLVYQSPKNENVTSELRNVLKVDDKLVPDSQARADKFLAELQKTKTLESELEKVQNESLRYDKTFKISGLTIYEGIVLADNLRPFFEFKLLGTDTFQGSEVYVVSYQQLRKSPFITVNEKEVEGKGLKADFDVSLPGQLKKQDKFLRGKLWIDAKTFQIWREERQLTVQSAEPLIALEIIFEYNSSEFGILVPKHFTFTENAFKKTDKDEFNVVKNAKITFDYSKFKKTNVEVKVLDDN